MSSLIGIHGDRWSLPRAIDAMVDGARQASKPGLHWVAGLLYPSVVLGFSATAPGVLSSVFDHLGFSPHANWWDVGSGSGSAVLDSLYATVAGPCCIGILLFPMFRFVAGLARIGPPEAWHEACAGRRVPRLSAVWRAGVGLTSSTLGLWIQFEIMMFAALFVLALPAAAVARSLLHAGGTLHDTSPLKIVIACTLLGPVALFFLLYTLSISVMTQLGLHSLAHNRRGVGSALLHAWRIMQHDAWATARAIVVDVVLSASILLIWKLFDTIVPVDWLSMTVYMVLMGFLGVARASYWARAYRALGGLSPDDGVPGLANPSTAWH
jgi:hypothetical protein